MAKIQPVKGTRDFYPSAMAFRRFLTDAMRETAKLFGYEEYDGPILEPFELYAAKSGDELVNQQSFVFEDRGNRKVVLRPELTPSLARMVAQQQQSLPKPIKWFSIGPMWRYEQPQKGRAREFLQWNVDCLGSPSPLADAEVIAMAIEFLKSLGLTSEHFEVRLNDRAWFERSITTQIGLEKEKVPNLLRAIDRIDKMDHHKWIAYTTELGISQSQAEKTYSLLKEESNHSDADLIEQDEPIRKVLDILADFKLHQFISIDRATVRGLDYYTGTVFEIRDRKGELRAIGGGGRYENLVEQVGGQPLPGVGFALGDMPVEELLRQAGKYPAHLSQSAVCYVTCTDEATYPYSITVAQALRNNGIRTELYIPTKDSFDQLSNQISTANKKQCAFVLLIGSNEKSAQTVTCKNLQTGAQATVPFADLLTVIR